MESETLAMAVALATAAWLGYQVVRGLRTGSIRVAGFHFSRTERPGEFRLILGVHAFVILVLLAVIALDGLRQRLRV